jgi:hypothetical protein
MKRYFCLVAIFLFLDVVAASGQRVDYLQRAETMYANILRYYRVPAYGLFAENFPSAHKDTLTYFQGAGVKEKEVSFLWPYSGMLSATNALLKTGSGMGSGRRKYRHWLDSLTAGMEMYHDTLRSPPGYQAYPVRFEKSDRYYDDNGLFGIEYMEAYFNTKDPVDLARAKAVFAFIISGWDSALGGGVYWLEGHKDQKPACSNGMAVLTALKIYQATHDLVYLEWGKKFYDWMEANLRDSTGVFWNDKKPDGSINKTCWSYNSGSMLEAAVLLYRFTGDAAYLKEAHTIAAGTLAYFGARSKNPHLLLAIDEPWFVTVLFKGYAALYAEDLNPVYIDAVIRSLDYAWTNSRDKFGFVTHDWTPDPKEMAKPKWLLDEACIAELYARISVLNRKQP